MAAYIKILKDSTGSNTIYPQTLAEAVFLKDENTIESKIQDLNNIIAELQELKANLNSPNLTGIPTAPTANKGTNSDQIATTSFVQSAMADVGGGTEIIVSNIQPDNQKTGDFWFKEI